MVLGMFGGSKTDRLVKKLTNAYAQTAERVRAMEILAGLETDESLFGLLKRFSYRVERDILDQDEKERAYELIVAAGDKAIPAIERYVGQYDSVYWPLKALRDIAGLEAAVVVLLRVLDAAEQREGRVNEQRDQLVANLRDFHHPLIEERLKGLCDDPSDEIRLKALDGLATYGPDAALDAFVKRILDPDESPSVKAVLFEQLVETGWSLGPWRTEIEENDILPSFYRLSGSGAVIRT